VIVAEATSHRAENVSDSWCDALDDEPFLVSTKECVIAVAEIIN
jgi:hypothetical protein